MEVTRAEELAESIVINLQTKLKVARDDAEALAEALGEILTYIEDANQPYERLGVGAIAREALARYRVESNG